MDEETAPEIWDRLRRVEVLVTLAAEPKEQVTFAHDHNNEPVDELILDFVDWIAHSVPVLSEAGLLPPGAVELLDQLTLSRPRNSRSARNIQPFGTERGPDLAEPFCAALAPVRELVVPVPAPRGDHGQDEDPALAQQLLIDARVVLADLFGGMGEVEFDRPPATRLEIYEQRPVLRGEHVARVRLAVQQLLGTAVLADHSSQVSQRVAEELPVRAGEGRSAVAARDELLSLLDPIGEMRRRDIELAHARVQPLEGAGVVGGWALSRCRWFVVGPERDHEAVTLIDPRVHAGLESRHRAAGRGELLGNLNFELCDLICHRCHPGQRVTRQQP